MSFIHSACNCMKSLLIICSESALVTSMSGKSNVICGRDINKSIFWDKVFQSYSFN